MIKIVDKQEHTIEKSTLLEKGIPKMRILACKNRDCVNPEYAILFFVKDGNSDYIFSLNSCLNHINSYPNLETVLFNFNFYDFVLLERREISDYIIKNVDGAERF